MSKTEVIIEAKRQHNRLKQNIDSFRKVTQCGFDAKQLQRLDKTIERWESQLDRELGQPLLDALKSFRKAYEADIEEDVIESYQALVTALWHYRTEHLSVIVSKHGAVSHYFDRFCQIKKRYRQVQPEKDDTQPHPVTVLLIWAILIGFIWWLI